MPMMDEDKLKRFLVLRQWLHVAAGACTWCSARIACVLVDKEAENAGEKKQPIPSWGCDQRQECETRAKIFFPSKPAPGEELTGRDSDDCPTCHDRAVVVMLTATEGGKGRRRVTICQKCRRADLGEGNAKRK